VIAGMLKLDVSPCPPELKNCLTAELYKIDPYPDDNYRPTKEVVEFPIKEIYEPFTTYRWTVFVYHN
jgi:dedicator of cytokinesis protein 6/7/8